MAAKPATAGQERGGRTLDVALLARRPAAWLAVAVVLTGIFSVGIAGLPAAKLPPIRLDASSNLIADQGSPAWADQVRYATTFGTDPIVIEVEPKGGGELLTGNHLIALASLEGDLGCRPNAGSGSGCRARPGVHKVYGPGTVVNTLALEVTKRGLEICAQEARDAQSKAVKDAAAAGKSSADQQAAGSAAFDAAARACAERLAAQYPGIGLPAINNAAFIRTVLIGPDGRTRAYWRWALPDPRHALIQVRMDPSATLGDVRALLAVIDEHVRNARPVTRAPSPSPGATTVPAVNGVSPEGDLSDLRVTVTGAPILALSLAESVQRALVVLLPLTVIAMLAVCFLVLRVPLRLLALPLAGLAAYWTAGAAGLARLPVTPATLAVLPVVLGLATDYALQAVNRLADETEGGPAGRVTRTARAILPPTAIAAAATAAGILAFAFSPLPLVRQFALFLAIGVACAYLAALVVGIPLFSLVLSSELRRFVARPGPPPRWEWLAAAGRAPLPVVVPLLLLGAAGWAALPLLKIETDPVRLMPAGDPSVAAAAHVRSTTGVGGEMDLVVTGPAVASPPVVAWMQDAEKRASGKDLQPEQSLASFLTAFNNGQVPDQTLTDKIIGGLPADFTTAVLNKDRTLARSAFAQGRLASVESDQADASRIRSLPAPPEGYRAYPAGLAVTAADALARLKSDLVWLNLLALGLVAAVLLVAFRSLRPALLALLPTAVAAGWATGAIWVTGVAQSPITVLLAGVVVAFSTEFSVLWLTRYGSERRAGADVAAAAATASARVGPAILASAAALAAGFLVLAASNVPMVRDFGLWSGADIGLATVAVLVLLPPLARRLTPS